MITECDQVKPNQHHCRNCRNAYSRLWRSKNHERDLDNQRKWRAANPERQAGYYASRNTRQDSLWTNHRITEDDYDNLLLFQYGRCAICGTTDPGNKSPYFDVDHDHDCCPGDRSCGKCIRGLLCGNCNKGIGLLGDNLKVVENAARYLGAK